MHACQCFTFFEAIEQRQVGRTLHFTRKHDAVKSAGSSALFPKLLTKTVMGTVSFVVQMILVRAQCTHTTPLSPKYHPTPNIRSAAGHKAFKPNPKPQIRETNIIVMFNGVVKPGITWRWQQRTPNTRARLRRRGLWGGPISRWQHLRAN